MQKGKYINQNQVRKKVIILIAVVSLIFVLLVLEAMLKNIQNENQEKELQMANGNFTSVEDILEYYGCQVIKIKNNTEGNFLVDIYTTFKYELYEDEKSNEEFYNKIINQIAKFLNYRNFRMVDQQKEEKIEIQVICGKNKIQKILINGIEDYFIYMDSQINLSKYKEIPTTEVSIQSPELISCIQNNWNANVNFGTRETIFQNYYIYFDEGIEVRKISGKIYNVVFTKNYVKPVVNGFTVGEKRDIIIRELGNPTFENENKSIIGYKTKDIYVFFEENQISIYRNITETGFDKFFTLVDKFLEEEYSLLEFMNELTYLWPDYEEYTYDAETVFLSYPNKGIDIKMNYDHTNGIVIYNNIGVTQNEINKYFNYTEFIALLQIDNVYNAEIRRVNKQLEFAKKCEEYQIQYEEKDNRNRGQNYDYYMKMGNNGGIICTYFIAKNPQYPNCELSENINSYIWVNEDCFVYSVVNKGIYYYDLKTQMKGTIITGNENFEIKSYQDDILKYDDSELQIKY